MKELCFLKGSCNCKLLVLIRTEEQSHMTLQVPLAFMCWFATPVRWVVYGKKVKQTSVYIAIQLCCHGTCDDS